MDIRTAPPRPGTLPPSSSTGVKHLSNEELRDRALSASITLVKGRLILGDCLLEMFDRELYWIWGYSSMNQFVELFLRVDPREAKDARFVARRLRALPLLREAAEAGELRWTHLYEACRVATPDNEDEWLAAARKPGVRRLRRMVANALKGQPRSDDPLEPPTPLAIQFLMELIPEEAELQQGAVGVLSAQAGRPLTAREAHMELYRAAVEGRIRTSAQGVVETEEVLRDMARIREQQDEREAAAARAEARQMRAARAAAASSRASAAAEGRTSDPGPAPAGVEGPTSDPGPAPAGVEGPTSDPGPAPAGVEGRPSDPGPAPAGVEGPTFDPGPAPAGVEGPTSDPGPVPQAGSEAAWTPAFQRRPGPTSDPYTLPDLSSEAHEEEAPYLPWAAALVQEAACPGNHQLLVVTSSGRTAEPETGCSCTDCAQRRTRHIPRWVRRKVMRRDGFRCQCPDCPHTVWLDLHHIVFWCMGGLSVPPNLVLLCRRCHRNLHQGRLRVRGTPELGLTFLDACGRVLGSTTRAQEARAAAAADELLCCGQAA